MFRQNGNYHKKNPYIIKKFGSSTGEGTYTKIITDANRHNYENLLRYLEEDEIPLIVC